MTCYRKQQGTVLGFRLIRLSEQGGCACQKKMFLEEQIKVIFQTPQYEPNLFDIKPKRPNEKQWKSVTVQSLHLSGNCFARTDRTFQKYLKVRFYWFMHSLVLYI